MSNGKLNIAIISHRVPYPPNKGEKIRTFYQIKHLVEQGHKVHVFFPTESENDERLAEELRQLLGINTDSVPVRGKWTYLLGLLQGLPLSIVNFYTPSLQRLIDEHLNTHLTNVLMCTSSSMAEYVFKSTSKMLSGQHRPKLIMDFMDLDSDKWRQYAELKSFPFSLVFQRESKTLFKYEQRIHRYFDHCFFISQAEVDLLHHLDSDLGKLHVIANGLDTRFFCPPAEPRGKPLPRLLFTGVMDYFPNSDAVHWFIENIWPEFRGEFPNAEFVIAGMNPSQRLLDLNDQNGIVVTGYVDDIKKYFDEADIFVAPFQIARGVQNKVLQAFACGLPVVGTPIAMEGIQCERDVHALVADSPDAFLKALITAAKDEDLRRKLSQASLALIHSRYSWEGVLAELDHIIS